MGVYQRGEHNWQMKLKLPGIDRINATFRDRIKAETYELLCKAAHKAGKPIPSPDDDGTASKASKVATIQDVYNRVWETRWSRGKSGEGGQPGNARRFIAWVGPRLSASDALDEDRVLEFLSEKEAGGISGSTLTHYVNAIKPLCTVALKLKLIDSRPEFPKYAPGKIRMRVLSEAEEAAMLSVMEQWGFDEHAALFKFLLDTGMRPGEAHKLRWEDFTDDGRVILEREITKNSTARVIGLTPTARDLVRRMHNQYPIGPWQWAHPQHHKTRRIVGMLRGHFSWDESFVVYTFRHTCASRLVRKGVSLYKVQIWMGHKTISMTQRYAKFAPDDITDLSKVLEPARTDSPEELLKKALAGVSQATLDDMLQGLVGQLKEGATNAVTD